MNIARTIRVVLVDDERRVRESAKRLLEEDAAIDVVGEAGDGRGAIRLAHDLSPNVVIMDISMPTMNGFDAAKQILKECPAVHVVLITAMEAEPYRRASVSLGINAFVPKESLDRELLKTIHELVH
ncbi:MAG TPA: response regulator transcription factor [Candidatus Acidoferrales bacterium]|nr:response regulator transcription factor [Candidatus Acidoferrales bacterium]